LSQAFGSPEGYCGKKQKASQEESELAVFDDCFLVLPKIRQPKRKDREHEQSREHFLAEDIRSTYLGYIEDGQKKEESRKDKAGYFFEIYHIRK
jgi:ribosome-binding protein aMBF1 (putative translation factor)